MQNKARRERVFSCPSSAQKPCTVDGQNWLSLQYLLGGCSNWALRRSRQHDATKAITMTEIERFAVDLRSTASWRDGLPKRNWTAVAKVAGRPLSDAELDGVAGGDSLKSSKIKPLPTLLHRCFDTRN